MQFSGLQYTTDVVQTTPLISYRTFHHIPEGDLAPVRHVSPAQPPAPGTHQPASCSVAGPILDISQEWTRTEGGLPCLDPFTSHPGTL